MNFNHSMQISASALSAQRLRMDTISNNLANATTTRTVSGKAYQRQQVVFRPMFEDHLRHAAMSQTHSSHMEASQQPLGGVKVVAVVDDQSEGKWVHEPNHPDANEKGYVEYPNVNPIVEMADMMSATRSYEASVAAVQAMKAMAMKALEMGRA